MPGRGYLSCRHAHGFQHGRTPEKRFPFFAHPAITAVGEAYSNGYKTLRSAVWVLLELSIEPIRQPINRATQEPPKNTLISEEMVPLT